MLLKSFKYSTFGWKLDGLSFGKANLIVGKNSSGKSKALEALSIVNSVLSQRKSEETSIYFNAELNFDDEEYGDIYLQISIQEKKIVNEVLKVNGDVKIERDGRKAIFEGETVSPPENMLLMHVRRDVRKYKYIEKIIKWSEEAVIRSFIDHDYPTKEELFEHILKFTPEMRKHLIKVANKVGFPLEDIGTFKDIVLKNDKESSRFDFDHIKIIMLKEKKVSAFLSMHALSSGMYRTIVLLILIEQLINLDRPALLAIDDLGEGLDYSRATKVGTLLFDICKKKNIQLIATSNEEFMMNIVDISNWNILVRKGEIVKSITSVNCPKEFENFKFMGLNNFDFFTSHFLKSVSAKIFVEEE